MCLVECFLSLIREVCAIKGSRCTIFDNHSYALLLSHRYGKCEPYLQPDTETICDSMLEKDVDYVYIPYKRVNGSQWVLNNFIETFNSLVQGSQLLVEEPCKSIWTTALCLHYYPRCGNETHFMPPPSICADDCIRFHDGVCKEVLVGLKEYFDEISVESGLSLLNCSNPGEFIDPIPHCCVGLPYLQGTVQLLDFAGVV